MAGKSLASTARMALNYIRSRYKAWRYTGGIGLRPNVAPEAYRVKALRSHCYGMRRLLVARVIN